jgi:hypothetical protein
MPCIQFLDQDGWNVGAVPQCQAEANWAIANYAQPRLRLASITIAPSANPALWPVALGVEVGDRVTVNRRPFGAPEISLQCYVEQVAHSIQPGVWKTTYSLSPVLDTTYGSESNWVLNFSQLDLSTRVA